MFDLTATDLPGAANPIKTEARNVAYAILRAKLDPDAFAIERVTVESAINKMDSLSEALIDRYDANVRLAQHDVRERVKRIRFVFPQPCKMRRDMIKTALDTYRMDTSLASTSYKQSLRLMTRAHMAVAKFDKDNADRYVPHT